jgi:hypothetical protein
VDGRRCGVRREPSEGGPGVVPTPRWIPLSPVRRRPGLSPAPESHSGMGDVGPWAPPDHPGDLDHWLPRRTPPIGAARLDGCKGRAEDRDGEC